MAHAAAEKIEPRLTISDPYIFEFLELKPSEAVAESDLEQAMLANLQEFLLELGHGFCLEARQKSILIGQTRGFVDPVFYHRVLKCHVLVEPKVDAFRHEHIGQLNTYAAWFQKNMMQEGDNPPVGLLLCTGKDMQRARQHHHPVFTAFCFPHHRHLAIKIHVFETQAAFAVPDFVAEEDLWQSLADVCYESATPSNAEVFRVK